MSKKKTFQLNGNTYTITTVPRSKLTEVWNLQKRLLEIAVPYDLAIGTVLTDETAVEIINQLLSVLDFYNSRSEVVKLKLDDFEDYLILGELFLGERNFSSKDEPIKESILSQVNKFGFLPVAKRLIMSLELEQMKTLMETPGIAQMNSL